MFQVKILVLTPKGKAKSSLNRFRRAIIGLRLKGKLQSEKILNDHSFEWILNLKDWKEVELVQKRCVKAEYTLKSFFKSLFKLQHRANFLMNKFKKGTDWMKRWLIKKLSKQYQENSELIQDIKNMSDEEFKEFFKFEDEDRFKEFLKQNLISVELL